MRLVSGLACRGKRPGCLRIQRGLCRRGRLLGRGLPGCSFLGRSLLGCRGLLGYRFFGGSCLFGWRCFLGWCCLLRYRLFGWCGFFGRSCLFRWCSLLGRCCLLRYSLFSWRCLFGRSRLLGWCSFLSRCCFLGYGFLRRCSLLGWCGFLRGGLLCGRFLRSCHVFLLDQVELSTGNTPCLLSARSDSRRWKINFQRREHGGSTPRFICGGVS